MAARLPASASVARQLQLLQSLSLRQRRPWSAASLLLVLTQRRARQMQLAGFQLLKAPWVSPVWLAALVPHQTVAMPLRQQGQRSVLGSCSQRRSQRLRLLLACQAGRAGLGPGRLLPAAASRQWPEAASPLLLRQQPWQRLRRRSLSMALILSRLLRRQLSGRSQMLTGQQGHTCPPHCQVPGAVAGVGPLCLPPRSLLNRQLLTAPGAAAGGVALLLQLGWPVASAAELQLQLAWRRTLRRKGLLVAPAGYLLIQRWEWLLRTAGMSLPATA